MICTIMSITLYLVGLFDGDAAILIASALFALASNVEIKINIGGNGHD